MRCAGRLSSGILLLCLVLPPAIAGHAEYLRHHVRHRHNERSLQESGHYSHRHKHNHLDPGPHKHDRMRKPHRGGEYGAPEDLTGRASRWTSLAFQPVGADASAAINNTVTNVSAQLGGAAFLPCRVGHLGDRQISWIRRRDWHVLTSGEVPYTNDQRFSVLHTPGTQDWTLHIKLVSARDNGTYECQVSTGTGIISLFVNLAVVTPEAHISGDGQYHVNKGSPIILICTFTKVLRPPKYVHWSHNGVLLNYAHNRPDVTILDVPTSEKDAGRGGGGGGGGGAGGGVSGAGGGGGGGGGAPGGGLLGGEDTGGGIAESRLEVKHADDHHSGNYTCTAPNTIEASTHVFVSEGDKTAAVQRIDSGTASSGVPLPALLTALALALTLR